LLCLFIFPLNTARRCAEYVKHLKHVNKEKEEALEKAKNLLKEKRQKLEEDKRAQQEGPSDPESTTSSLTVSSEPEGRKPAKDDIASPESANNGESRKRKADEASKSREKKSRLRAHESSGSSSDDGGGEKPPAQQQVNVGQMVSVSDITDSGKDSSSDGNSSSGCQKQRPNPHKSPRSGSPYAPDLREPSTRQDDRSDVSDVVIAGRKRKAAASARSKEKCKTLKFELDYEEVFLKSNVPQILATTSGRIVSWNDFFLKATNLTANEIDRLTIFSLVQSSKLSSLFEIVAMALRTGTLDSEASEAEQGKESTDDATEPPSNTSDAKEEGSGTPRKGNYTAITLPCTNFGPRPKRGGKDESKDNEHFTVKPLYMTVTLMADKDPRKRCFHCVLTDCPGTNGALGRVTPELLSLLFQ